MLEKIVCHLLLIPIISFSFSMEKPIEVNEPGPFLYLEKQKQDTMLEYLNDLQKLNEELAVYVKSHDNSSDSSNPPSLIRENSRRKSLDTPKRTSQAIIQIGALSALVAQDKLKNENFNGGVSNYAKALELFIQAYKNDQANAIKYICDTIPELIAAEKLRQQNDPLIQQINNLKNSLTEIIEQENTRLTSKKNKLIRRASTGMKLEEIPIKVVSIDGKLTIITQKLDIARNINRENKNLKEEYQKSNSQAFEILLLFYYLL